MDPKNIVFVKLLPDFNYKPDLCFPNVEKKVGRNGGEIVFGWRVHECQEFFQLTHHAVWKSPEDCLIDVTPGSSSNRFIPDPDALPLGQKPSRMTLSARFLPKRDNENCRKGCDALFRSTEFAVKRQFEQSDYWTYKAERFFSRSAGRPFHIPLYDRCGTATF